MINKLRIVLWNANGLARHANEIKTYLRLQEIDIMLISETHFTTLTLTSHPALLHL